MFNITQAMQAYWREENKSKATNADIILIEEYITSKLPAPYVEFITQFGFVTFGDDAEERDCFDYTFTSLDQKEIREGDISHFKFPDKILMYHKNLTQSKEGEEFPKFPSNYLPIGMDAGQGEILLELGEHAGRIWYWPFSEWAWGMEDNTQLGFVANNLYEFINGLRPWSGDA